MPLAYWCVLVAAVLPVIIVSYAKAGADFDNHHPRDTVDALPPRRRRAYAAHQNAYENFPFFAAAVIVAVTLRAPVDVVNGLAVVYVVLRIAHAGLYVADQATLRSLVYLAGWLVNVAIFVLPAFN